LPDPFQVFATRNPIEQEGTYPLPEAQLDRFLLEVHVDYPSDNEEQQIARKTTSADFGKDPVPRVLSRVELIALQSLVPRMPITDEAVTLAVQITRATRPEKHADKRAQATTSKSGVARAADVDTYVRFGAGPRGSQALVLASKARAALRGHAAADIDDIRALLVPVLRHRLVMSYRAESDGVTEADLIGELCDKITR
jgi:MoxR-like ATPase